MTNYKIKLTTLAPIHIGGGKKINKQEYLYNSKQEFVSFINGALLIKYLKNQNLLEKYFEYIDKPYVSNLQTFLIQNNVGFSEWNQFISHREKVHQGKTDGKFGGKSTNKPLNDINTFVRNGRNEIYVPGSSLKGALRTTILNNFNEDRRDNELFKYIKVSDSKPISNDRLAIYQKIDINKTSKPMPLYRECIIPETTFEFILSIDNKKISIKEIENAISRFYTNYNEKWLKGFINTDGGTEFFQKEQTYKNITDDNTNYIYIGGGVGYVSKGLHYQVFDKEVAKREVFEQLKRNGFTGKVYRKFRTVPKNVPIVLKGTVDLNKNEYYQQGLCKIEFIKQ